jgi:hypothetical protein
MCSTRCTVRSWHTFICSGSCISEYYVGIFTSPVF